jgi:hypothetical protein
MIIVFGILLALFILLNFLDIDSTYRVVSRLGLHAEKNPLARWIFRKLGLRPGLYALKGVLFVLIPFIIGEYPEAKTELIWALALTDALYVWVVTNNYRIWWRIRRRETSGFPFASSIFIEGQHTKMRMDNISSPQQDNEKDE